MKITYNATTIESILNALNKLQITGLQNAEIVTFIVQELNKNEVGEVDGNTSKG